MGVSPTNHEPKATALGVSQCGEEAGEQSPDLMDKNHVMRHGMRGKLTNGSNAQTGLKQFHVNVARLG